MPARVESFDHACTGGPPPRRAEVRDHDHARPRGPARAAPRPAGARPPAPRCEPSIDASTSVFCDGRPWYTRASCISAAVSAALPGASGTDRRVARRDDHDLPARAARAPADHVHEPLAVGREPLHDRARSAAAREAARGERVGHELGGRAVARASPRAGRAPAAAIRVGQVGRLIAVEQHVGGQPLPQRPGPALEREHRQHDGQERRHERRAVDPRLDHEAHALNLQFGRLSAAAPTHPARGRRAVRPEAPHVPAAQGGLRRHSRARRARGARPAARGQLRPRRARRDAAADGRLRRVPRDPLPQHGADHHAHREDRGDRQGARPRAGRRRLHHEAVLDPRVLAAA